MVPIVQLVRASDCGSECRGFESHWAPFKSLGEISEAFFVYPRQDFRSEGISCKICIYIGKPEADLVCSIYLLYISKKRRYIYVLKLVPTVLENGQNELRPISWTQCQMIWEKLVIV